MQEHALPQLPGFPLIVSFGKTTTVAHAAPIVLTQYVCMETFAPAGELAPEQIGRYQEVSEGKGQGKGTNVSGSRAIFHMVSNGQRSSLYVK